VDNLVIYHKQELAFAQTFELIRKKNERSKLDKNWISKDCGDLEIPGCIVTMK